MVINTQDTNYFIGGMVINSWDTNYSIGGTVINTSIIHKPFMGSHKVPQKILARAVQPF